MGIFFAFFNVSLTKAWARYYGVSVEGVSVFVLNCLRLDINR